MTSPFDHGLALGKQLTDLFTQAQEQITAIRELTHSLNLETKSTDAPLFFGRTVQLSDQQQFAVIASYNDQIKQLVATIDPLVAQCKALVNQLVQSVDGDFGQTDMLAIQQYAEGVAMHRESYDLLEQTVEQDLDRLQEAAASLKLHYLLNQR